MSTTSDDRRLTILVPALNEEQALGPTLDKILATVPRFWADWEILVFNDGSTDATGLIADRYAAANPRVRAFHHARPLSLGGIFRRGLQLAKHDHLVVIHGQNDITLETLESLFQPRNADLVIPYPVNAHERPWGRFLLSRAFVTFVNAVFGLRLRYYNHYVLFRRELLRDLTFRTRGYAFQAEILVKLIKQRGCSYIQIPVRDDFSNKRKSRALRPRNVLSVLKFFATTFVDLMKPEAAR